jgi:hypothetical protein
MQSTAGVGLTGSAVQVQGRQAFFSMTVDKHCLPPDVSQVACNRPFTSLEV